MQPHIAIIVDHPLRDLGGCTLVAAGFSAKGARVSLVPMNLMNAEIFALRPDFVLLNYLRQNNAAFVRRLIAAGIAYGILDTEGGLYTKMETYRAVFPTERALLENTRVYCSWGRKVADYLVAEGIFTPHQVVVTGLPRFDFYAPDHRAAKKVPTRPLVMINTKVWMANPGVHSLEKELDLYIHQFGWPPEKVYRLRDIGLATLREILAMANRLASDFPQADFVIRPHPHERLSTYQQGIDPKNRNLTANQSDGIDTWIAKASALIHRSCTTALEAALAGVPALSASWIPTSAEAADCDAVSIDCADYAQMKKALAAILSGGPAAPEMPRAVIQRIIDDWFYSIDGQSYQRVVEAVWPCLPTRREVNEKQCRRFLKRLDEPCFSKRGSAARLLQLSRVMLSSKRYFDLLYPARKKWSQGLKSYTADGVEAKLTQADLIVQPPAYADEYAGMSVQLLKQAA